MGYFSENAQDLRKCDALAMEVDLSWRDLILPESMRDYPEKFEGTCGNKGNPFHLFLISKVDPPFGLWSQVHGHVESGRLIYLQVNLDRKPTKRVPPEEWVKISDRLGGYPDGLNRLFSELQGQGGSCDAELRLFFQKSPFKIARRRFRQKEISPFRAESETLTLLGPDDVELDIYFNDKGGLMVNIEARLDMEINQGCIETACAALREKLSPILKEQ